MNAWDIHHLHFRSSGSDHILLCKIIDDAVFMIRASDHTGDSRPLWVDTELLRAVHDNWPEQLADRRIMIKSSTPPAADRIFVRANNGNFTVTMPDGTVYVSLLTASGECIEDLNRCRDISRELVQFEQFVRDNAREFRAGLDWQDPVPEFPVPEFP